MKLGERLVGLGQVTREQVAEALKAQSLYGARLGTHLVQLGAIELDPLTHALGAHLEMPVATQAELEAVRGDVLARLSAALAEAHLAVPLAARPSGFLVAMVDPTDLVAVAALERALDGRVQPAVVPELRLRYWLEKHYGIARENRFLRAFIGDSGNPGSERRRYITTSPQLSLPTAPSLSLDTQARLGRIIPVKRAAPQAAPVAPPPEEDDLGLDITVDARRRSQPAAAAIGAIEQAVTGEHIADAVVSYFVEVGEPGLLLRVHGQYALGWRGAPPVPEHVVGQITIPLELPTALRTAVELGATFRGVPPAETRTWHDRLGALLTVGSPREVLAVPVGGVGGVRALIFAQTADRPLGDGLVADLEAIGAAISTVLDRRARGA